MALRSSKQLQQPVENLELDTGHFPSQDEEEEVEEVYSDPEPVEFNAKLGKPSVDPESSRTTRQEADTQTIDQGKQGEPSREVDVPRPPPPFPVRNRARKMKLQDREYLRFVQMLKEVKINVSAHELFTGIPKYAKFFKTMLSNTEDVAEEEMIELSARCSSIFEKNILLSRKLKDPGSCTIPCKFGDKATYKALCDLGSGVSIMPRSIAEELDLVSEMKYTSATLMLADRSLIKPQ